MHARAANSYTNDALADSDKNDLARALSGDIIGQQDWFAYTYRKPLSFFPASSNSDLYSECTYPANTHEQRFGRAGDSRSRNRSSHN